MKILLAEDTRDLNRAVSVLLSHEGHLVDSVFDGAEALDKIGDNAYDCILLDIMMPRVDGIGVLTELRRRHITTPVILLTAKSEIDDRVAGLDAGADDYLPKPFAMKELLARIRSNTRRGTEYGMTTLRFGDVALESATFALTTKSSVRLSVKEFELMQILMQETDTAVSTEALIGRVWKGDDAATADTVWLYISYLRGKLLSVGSTVTVEGTRGGSYRLVDAH
jgi:DNA-binding response OmpR family regulator